jgi:GDP-L-fucose synthase
MKSTDRIFVAGHRGLAGSAIVRELERQGFSNLILKTRHEADLSSRDAVDRLFASERPDYVFLAAGKVGGILANSQYPATFLYDNLAIELNVIDSAWRHGVKKLEFLGSSCIYPKLAPQPLKEEYLLTGPLEPTNEWYAVAKIAGIKLCQAYRAQYGFNAISLMPTNLYGPGDNFDLESSHVLPALIRKFDAAQKQGQEEVAVWGTGTPRREFLHVDDLAAATLFVLEHNVTQGLFNVGVGADLSIRELAECICKVVGFEGELVFDASKPDGTPRKLLEVSRLAQMGWKASIGLEDGIASTYRDFVESHAGSTPAAAIEAWAPG